MGYYKNTAYYGPNAEDHADNSPEAQAEHKLAKRDYSWLTDRDTDTCLVCEAQAPEGQMWVDGICTGCR